MQIGGLRGGRGSRRAAHHREPRPPVVPREQLRLHERLLGERQNVLGLLSRNGREVVEELVETVAGLQIVEKRPHGDPCPREHGRPAKNLSRGPNYRLVRHG